ncbi:MAG: helix-turn-helix transcriptional regulator [Rhodospirillaceae bacterium]|nr:helix-turn-helix transcriptional regulator [Rhodospirillaceae bacterium]
MVVLYHHPGVAQGSEVDCVEACTRSQGERLAWLRQRAGLTLDGAAERSGISKSELSRLENGTRRLTYRHIKSLVGCYNVDIVTLQRILDFDPKEVAMIVPGSRVAADAAGAETRDYRCYFAHTLEGVGLSAEETATVVLSQQLELSGLGYGVLISSAASPLPLGLESLAVVDPTKIVRLGDTVVNTWSWSPLFVTLARSETGELLGRHPDGDIGFPPDTQLSSLHKVIAFLTSAHLYDIV